MLNNIASSKPALGGVVSADNNAVGISAVVADRPYILGSAVTKIVPLDDKIKPLGVVGKGATIAGVMALGINQIPARGFFVDSGFDSGWNNIGFKGAFWCALDLKNFNATDFADFINTKTFSLSVDKNGVFSIAKTMPADNEEVTNGVVLGVHSGIIQEALDKSITIGANTYEFKYPNGIGAICIAL